MSVKVVQDDVPLLLKAILALSREEVIVGIPEGGPSHAGSDLSNAAIGYVMEAGDPATNLPSRPFLGPGMDRAKSAMIARLRAGAVAALKDTASLKTASTAIHDALEDAGAIGADAVQKEMRSGGFTPLAASTVKARRSRGNSSTKPLIDTQELYDAVTHEVRPKR
ncbi:hypothetical protein MKK50_18165 [Methylobacterium sp. J-043]|nr:hypothetical protein [Methylobacterium sp. J-043]